MSSANTKARQRQKATGEKYMRALAHIRDECSFCHKGQKCSGCVIDPCWTCRPDCVGNPGKKCQFDDLLPNGNKKCVTCETFIVRTVKPTKAIGILGEQSTGIEFQPNIAHWLANSSDPATAPLFPGDTKIVDKYPNQDAPAKKLRDDIIKNGVNVPKEVLDKHPGLKKIHEEYEQFFNPEASKLPVRPLQITLAAGAKELKPGESAILRVPHTCELSREDWFKFAIRGKCPNCGGAAVIDDVRSKGESLRAYSNTRTGRQPSEYHERLNEAMAAERKGETTNCNHRHVSNYTCRRCNETVGWEQS